MNIQFHYFVVRYLSRRMGFDDKTSRVIAGASQYVDESNEITSVSFTKAEIIGKKVEQRGLYVNDGAKVKVFIPKTIHKSFDEFDKFDDFDYKDTKNICWQSLVPFHYPPLMAIDHRTEECLNYLVEAPSRFDERGIFRELTDYCIDQYQMLTNQNSDDAQKDSPEETAIRIGVLTHMLADCYAHANVNGLVTGEGGENDTNALQVMNGDMASYITSDYQLSDDEKNTIPFVGQYRTKTLLDDCYVRANIMKNINPPQHFVHDSFESSMAAARCIYDFFLKLLDLRDDAYSIWNGTYVTVIKPLLSFRSTDIEKLAEMWHAQCPDIDFTYSKDTIKRKLTDKESPEYLFGAAVVADDMRQAVHIKEINKDLSYLGESAGSISFGPVTIENNEFTLTATGTTADGDTPKILSMLLFNERSQQVDSGQFDQIEGGNSIIGQLNNTVPDHAAKFKLQAMLYTEKSGKTIAARGTLPITFEDLSSLIICTENNLSDIHKDEILVSFNSKDTRNADISYPDNSDYFNQDNSHMIDIVLPVSVKIQVDKNYTFNSVVPTLKLKDGTNLFIHCGNDKKNSVVFNKKNDVCTIKFGNDWKNSLSLDKYYKNEVDLSLGINLLVSITAQKGAPFIGKRTFVWESSPNVFPVIKTIWKVDAHKR